MLIVFFVIAAAMLDRTVCAAAQLQAGDIKVAKLLSRAKQASEAGDMSGAEVLWSKARTFNPSLARPAWLDQVIEPNPYREPTLEEMLAAISQMPYLEAKSLLEALLTKEPSNRPLRELYFRLAKENLDEDAVASQLSLLYPNHYLMRFLRYFLVLIIFLAVAWQTVKLYDDYHSS
ncbi:MAG TPA: hypothetical protein DCG57_06215 [Candidatus Riflebacteria bacterium]|jgi:hypothetical protein|nr:hypothetical protein [Candidatus Riflebacteria bacterium]